MAQTQCAEATARKLGINAEVVLAEDDAVNQSTQLLKAIQSQNESRPYAIMLETVGYLGLKTAAISADWAID